MQHPKTIQLPGEFWPKNESKISKCAIEYVCLLGANGISKPTILPSHSTNSSIHSHAEQPISFAQLATGHGSPKTNIGTFGRSPGPAEKQPGAFGANNVETEFGRRRRRARCAIVNKMMFFLYRSLNLLITHNNQSTFNDPHSGTRTHHLVVIGNSLCVFVSFILQLRNPF